MAREAAQLLYEYASPTVEMVIDCTFLQSKVLGDLTCPVASTLELYDLFHAWRESLVKRAKNASFCISTQPLVRGSYVFLVFP
jgi:hypothetical protein